MVEWNEYLNGILNSHSVFDGLTLENSRVKTSFSPIIKASIQMLESMISTEGKHNILVFPDVSNLGFEFVMAKVIFNISVGKIHMSYDPHSFTKGEFLKYKNCTVQFDSCDTNFDDGIERICFFLKGKNSLMRLSVPIDQAPFFQKATSTRVSSYKLYCNAKKDDALTKLPSVLGDIKKNKTHLDGSIYYVGSINKMHDLLSNTFINGTRIPDILFVGHANSKGEIKNVFSGQLSGNPAIVLSSDLYNVVNAVKIGAKIQSIIVSFLPSEIEKQLDALDYLSSLDLPIVFITDTQNSFNLSQIEERGFSLWRWDSKSLTSSTILSENRFSETKLYNCAHHSIDYVELSWPELSNSVSILYKHKKDTENCSTALMSILGKLFSLSFAFMRSIVPFSDQERISTSNTISLCKSELEKEKKYINSDLYNDLAEVIKNYEITVSNKFNNPKISEINKIILSKRFKRVCFVVPERVNKRNCEIYWKNYGMKKHSSTIITIMYPTEYKNTDLRFDLTIISGWFGNVIMRTIIYSFVAPKYMVFTFECEEAWKKSHTQQWKCSLNHSGNSKLIRHSFSKPSFEISVDGFEENNNVRIDNPTDEVEDFETFLNRGKYHIYSTKNADTIAVPVSFIGGSIAFYSLGHKVVTVTDIIENNSDKYCLKLPNDLCVGDFIVVRETEKDIVRDIADKMMERSGQMHLRKLASKWKEALSIELLFSTVEELHNKLVSVGCTKDIVTLKNWLNNDEIISPQQKEDLVYISMVTEDAVLSEKIDEIYSAGQYVKSVHIKAGRNLSNLVKEKIASTLQEKGIDDPYNVWDPIALQIEDIGTVKILKAIDVGEPLSVDSSYTNRLINE